MNADIAWATIASIPIGTVVSWIILISIIVGGICAISVKLYKAFDKFRDTKDENEMVRKAVKEHDQVLADIQKSLNKIESALDEQKDINLKQTRYSIVQIGEDAILLRCIPFTKLRLLEELYEQYVRVFNGNSYVKDLVERVRLLPVQESQDLYSRMNKEETCTHES